MKVSGFSMVKNADKLYYPIKASILSILPIVDEFVITIGDCDKDDKTRQIVENINSNKIKIIDTVWDIEKYKDGAILAYQTDIAKENCSGDWLFYLQSDEVVHEKYLDIIYSTLNENLNDTLVEGFILSYKHFWGDYWHYHKSHGWYPYEIRIIRNDKDIHSWRDAQSFRRIPNFNYTDYYQINKTFKLNVKKINAEIYHYGWVRPPSMMQNKRKSFHFTYKGKELTDNNFSLVFDEFDYGPLDRLFEFKESHPSVMNEWIDKFNWAEKLQYSGKPNKFREKLKHERLRNRILTFIEQNFLDGKQIFTFKNYNLLKDK